MTQRASADRSRIIYYRFLEAISLVGHVARMPERTRRSLALLSRSERNKKLNGGTAMRATKVDPL